MLAYLALLAAAPLDASSPACARSRRVSERASGRSGTGIGVELTPARIGIAAAFCALLVHTIGYAAYLTDPLTWALLAVGGVLAAEIGRATGPAATVARHPPRASVASSPMTGYLRRLATTGAAYTASSVISKLIAVALLPLYTRYLTPGRLRRRGGADHRGDRGQHRDPPRDHRGAAALLLPGRTRTPTRS